jgi:hypothetical protein
MFKKALKLLVKQPLKMIIFFGEPRPPLRVVKFRLRYPQYCYSTGGLVSCMVVTVIYLFV